MQKKFEKFLIFSPILDLITAYLTLNQIFPLTLGSLIRAAILFLFIIYIIVYSQSKYSSLSRMYILFLIIYFFVFMILQSINKPLFILFREFETFIKYFYFPILLVGILNLYEKNDFNLNLLSKVIFIYAFFIFFPTILGLSYSSYGIYELGNKGWFYAANEVGTILAILFPIAFYNIFFDNKKYVKLIALLIITYTMFQIGTKVPALAVLITISFVTIIMIFKSLNNKKNVLLIFLIIPLLFFVGLSLRNSPTLDVVQLVISNTYNTTNINSSALRSNTVIFSSRDLFLENVSERAAEESIVLKVFGMGYYDHNNISSNRGNLTELDFHDVYYFYGKIGFVLYFFFIFVLFFHFLRIVIKQKKLYYNWELTFLFLSMAIGLSVAAIAGHTISAPAVSVFLAISITKFYLTYCKAGES